MAAKWDEGLFVLSVLCQYGYDVQTVMDIAPGSFWPKPQPASRVLLRKKKVPSSATILPCSFPCCRPYSRHEENRIKSESWLALNKVSGYNGAQENLAADILSSRTFNLRYGRNIETG